ncbi:HdeD family acid-resistance protein [Enterococcus sp. DIV0180]|uniref:HdeD family acid-resistance protein n=1 Tax=Enterococcus sp. DIV0180 TaxID=2774749 RepID=UPI003D2FAE12
MIEGLKRNFKTYALVRAIIYIVLGVLIVINPRAVFNLIGYLITTYFCLLGIFNLFEDYKRKKQVGSWGFGLFSGIIFLILALVVLFFAPAIASILPILLGLAIICNGIFQLIMGLNMKSTPWLIYSVLLLIGGIVLLFNPFASLLVLFQIFGVILIVMGVSEAISFFKLKKMTIN